MLQLMFKNNHLTDWVLHVIHKGLICTKQKLSQRKRRELNMCFTSLRVGYIHGTLELRIITALQMLNVKFFNAV